MPEINWIKWGAIAAGVLFLFFLIWPSFPQKQPAKEKEAEQAKKESEVFRVNIQTWQNRVDQDITSTKQRLDSLESGQKELKTGLDGVGEGLKSVSEELKAQRELLERQREEIKAQSDVRVPIGPGITTRRFQDSRAEDEDTRRNAPQDALRVEPAEPVAFLPAGSMVRSTLLNGVAAPVGRNTTPFPVLFALREAFAAPNFFTVPLQGCMALGKAEGSASSERINIEVTRLSCVFKNGGSFEGELTGYIVGKDGLQGVEGKLIDHPGRQIAIAALVGIADGLARGFRQAETTNIVSSEGDTISSVTGDTATTGVASGAQGAAQALRQFFERRADALMPVVEVDGGQEVTMVVLSGITVPDFLARSGASAAGLGGID